MSWQFYNELRKHRISLEREAMCVHKLTEGDVWVLLLDYRSLVLCEEHVGRESSFRSIWVLLSSLGDISLDGSWFGIFWHDVI